MNIISKQPTQRRFIKSASLAFILASFHTCASADNSTKQVDNSQIGGVL